MAGQPGRRCSAQVVNHTRGRVLAVISVDGVNVTSGETASSEQSGFALAPHHSHDIAGWRNSTDEIASFEIAALPDGWAARTGRPAVGVIGMPVFRERSPPQPRP